VAINLILLIYTTFISWMLSCESVIADVLYLCNFVPLQLTG